ncbi:MAG: 30S ribosomal protein S17 [Chloroflexota bacterium]|nr:30S ribosomal protein S17 [Chloroflexota bacterium]
MTQAGNSRKNKIGRVVGDRMDKTVVVAVVYYSPHRIYKKPVKHVSKFKAHDEQNTCKVGDEVLIEETRPLSKDKRWKVIEILSKGDL